MGCALLALFLFIDILAFLQCVLFATVLLYFNAVFCCCYKNVSSGSFIISQYIFIRFAGFHIHTPRRHIDYYLVMFYCFLLHNVLFLVKDLLCCFLFSLLFSSVYNIQQSMKCCSNTHIHRVFSLIVKGFSFGFACEGFTCFVSLFS